MILTPLDALVALLARDPDGQLPDESFTDVVQVVNGEPRPGDLRKPVSVTVTSPGGDPTTVQFLVRVYVSVEVGALAAHRKAYTALEECEALIDGDARFTRGNWSIDYSPELDSLIVAYSVSAIRDDF